MTGIALIATFTSVVMLQGKLNTIFVGEEFIREKCKIYTMFWTITLGYTIIVINNCFMLNENL